MKFAYILAIIIGVLLAYLSFTSALSSSPTTNVNITTPTSSPIITPPNPNLVKPIDDFDNRITKKSFGTFVRPGDSPVSPEKFTGYHTAVDIEYSESYDSVPVYSITDGQIIYSGWAQGYGGVIAIRHRIEDQDFIGIYGHLNTASMLPVSTAVTTGQQIGVLGDGYSRDTDDERKHLHFGLLKGIKLNLLGYVQNKEDLDGWVDPKEFFN